MSTFQPEWDKTGTLINGNYLGTIPYTGIIESSRVCYGSDIEYTVRLFDHIKVWGEWRSIILVRRELDKNKYELIEEVA